MRERNLRSTGKTSVSWIAVHALVLMTAWGAAYGQQTGTCRVGGAVCSADSDCLGRCSIAGSTCSGAAQCNLPGDTCIDKICDPLPATARGACKGTVDPDCYLTISLEGRRQETLVGPHIAAREVWEVVPTRGSLEVSFDLHEMKDRWDFDTEGSLSMWARKVSRPDPNGGGAAVEIGIPPYSSLVEGLQVRSLDLAAAANLMNQMFDGSRRAHEIVGFASAARLARLEAELARTRALREAYLDYLVAAEDALTQLYTESLRFTLDVADVERAAEILSTADSAVTAAEQMLSESALDAAENAYFFAELRTVRSLINDWLAGLQSPQVKPYLPVMSGLIERPNNVVEGAVASVQRLLATIDAKDADETARVAARRGLEEIAKKLIDIETELHTRYRELDESEFAKRARRRQYTERQVGDFTQDDIEAFEQFKARVLAALKGGETSVPCGSELAELESWTPPPASQEPTDDDTAKRQAQERFDSLEPLLEWIRGGKLPDPIATTIKKRFTAQIEALRQPLKEMESRIAELEGKVRQRGYVLAQVGSAIEQCKTERERISNTIATLVMIDIMDTLIDQIVPGTLSLENADLDPGDRLEILVSFSKPVVDGKLPPAQSYSFTASPFGWRAPFPYITDATSYAKPAGSSDYEFRPGLIAVWNYYGRARKLKSAMRTLAPGFGIHAIALQFSDDQEADDEFGVGLGVTLFDNLLTLAGGWNLQAKKNDSRTYFSVGISVRRAMEKFTAQQ